jgi:hypothetical protein
MSNIDSALSMMHSSLRCGGGVGIRVVDALRSAAGDGRAVPLLGDAVWLVAVGGSWLLVARGCWWLVAVGGGWWLVVAGGQLNPSRAACQLRSRAVDIDCGTGHRRQVKPTFALPADFVKRELAVPVIKCTVLVIRCTVP